MKLLSKLVLGAFIATGALAIAAPVKNNCNCQNCECTMDSHCGCFSKEGCTDGCRCSKKEGSSSKKEGNQCKDGSCSAPDRK